MRFSENLKYAIGISNYFENKFKYLLQNLFIFLILLYLFSFNSARLINNSPSNEFNSIFNSKISSLTIFNDYLLFLISAFILFFLLINLLSLILVIISKIFGSNADIKLFYSLIYPYIIYFNLFFFSFVLFSSGINLLIYLGFLLFYFIFILFIYSLIKNYSNYLGLSRIFYLIFFLTIGVFCLIWYLI